MYQQIVVILTIFNQDRAFKHLPWYIWLWVQNRLFLALQTSKMKHKWPILVFSGVSTHLRSTYRQHDKGEQSPHKESWWSYELGRITEFTCQNSSWKEGMFKTCLLTQWYNNLQYTCTYIHCTCRLWKLMQTSPKYLYTKFLWII